MLALWLPVLVSAVVVFFAAYVLHMVLPHHKSDFVALPDQDAMMVAARAQGIGPGQYDFPHMTGPDAFKDPAMKAKADQGPVGILIVGPNGMPNMGKMLGLNMVYNIVVAVFVGYIGWVALGPGAEYLTVFRISCTAALLGFAGAYFPMTIWYYYKWSHAWKYLFDGLVSALLMAGVFGWLWPA